VPDSRPHVILVAAPERRRSVEQRLVAGAPTFRVTLADGDHLASEVHAGQPDAILLAPASPPASEWARGIAATCTPVPVFVVAARERARPAPVVPGVAAYLADDQRLAALLADRLAQAPAAVGHGYALRAVLGRAPDALLLVEASGRIVAANAAFSALTGWSEAALWGRALDSLVAADITARLRGDDGAAWTACPVELRCGGEAEPIVTELRASVVHIAAAGATWLLHFKAAPPPRLSESPVAAAEAMDALTTGAREAGRKVGGANVRLIGLSRARQLLGDRWPQFQRRIALVCETTIERELATDDVAMTTETGDYLICFACEDHDEADRRADRLQATIDRRLFGRGLGEFDTLRGGREALEALSVEVEGAVLEPELELAPHLIADRFAQECANRRRDRLAEFNRQLEDLRTSGELELLPVATARGPLPALVRASWFPADHGRLQRLAERANRLDELRLALDLRRLALIDTAEADGVFDDVSAIVDLHITTIERRKSWELVLPLIQGLASSPRFWLVPNVVGVPRDVYPGRLRDAVVTLKPFSRTQTVTLNAKQLAELDLKQLSCRLFMITATEAANVLGTDLPARIAERLELARAKLAIDGGSATLAADFGASLRTVRGEPEPPPAA